MAYRLRAPLPVDLAAALGYHGEGRFCAFFWLGGEGLCCLCSEGVRFPAEAHGAWELLQDHPLTSEIGWARLGDRHRTAELWLVPSLWEGAMYLAAPAETAALLSSEPSEFRALIATGQIDSLDAAMRLDEEAWGPDGRRWRAEAEVRLRADLHLGLATGSRREGGEQ
ncbi:MAG: hypothetical protein ACR2K6_02960 [Solirubrobacterales bacterium]